MRAPTTPADFERLLTHSSWLASLARRLVRDPSVADDLVQDTWCAALRAPPENVANERGWLATLIANLARARARNESARTRRERAVASDESIDGPDSLVERAEAQRHLLGLVLTLDEPYRTTLLARYVEGRASVEIAQRERVSESTVRTRLQRAHDQLREHLRREHRDGGLMALAPLLAFEPSVHVPWTGALLKSLKAAAATTGIGVGIVSTTSKVLLVAAIAVCAWLAWDRAGEKESAPAPLSSELAANAPLERSARAPSEIEPVVEQRESIEAKPAPAPTPSPKSAPPAVRSDATLDVAFKRDRVPVPGIAVWAAPRDEWPILEALGVRSEPPASAKTARTNGEGVAAFKELKPARYTVGFDVAGKSTRPTRFTTVELFSGHRYEIALGNAVIRGRAYDERGRPRAGVGIEVCAAEPDAAYMILSASVLTNEQGDYVVGDLAQGEYDVFLDPEGRFDGHGNVEFKRVAIGANEERVVDFGSIAPAPIWTGRVLNALGEPFECSACRLDLKSELDASRISVPIDADGHFHVAFRPGKWRMTAFVPGCSDAGHVLGNIELPPNDLERDVVVPGARLRGKLEIARDASVPPSRDSLSISVRPKGHDYPAAFRAVSFDNQNGFWIDGLEPGTWTVAVYPGRFVEGDTIEITIAPGETVVVRDLRVLTH